MKNTVSVLLALGSLAAVGQAQSYVTEWPCYAFPSGIEEEKLQFNAYAVCAEQCNNATQPYFAARGQYCFCLDSMPSDDKKVDQGTCDEQCPGYGLQRCGGNPGYLGGGQTGYYSVGEVDYYFRDNSTNATSTSTDSLLPTLTASQTWWPSSTGLPSNISASATPSSGSATGSSASSSPTVAGSSGAAPVFGTSFTVVTSLVGTAAVLAALM